MLDEVIPIRMCHMQLFPAGCSQQMHWQPLLLQLTSGKTNAHKADNNHSETRAGLCSACVTGSGMCLRKCQAHRKSAGQDLAARLSVL